MRPDPMVWSLVFPQTRLVVESIITDPSFLDMFENAWEERYDYVSREFLDVWMSWSGLSFDGFPYAYNGNGSSEVIRQIVYSTPRRIVVFEGEYEGYAAVAREFGLEVVVTSRSDVDGIWMPDDDFGEGTTYFISNPSGIDGEYWLDLEQFLNRLARVAPKARVSIDLAYHGITRNTMIVPVHHPMVTDVIFSMSKVFGMYKWRTGGVVSRHRIMGLSYNHHFSGLAGQVIGLAMMRRYAPGDLPGMYFMHQRAIVKELIASGAVPADTVPSNVLLLARSATPHADVRFNRGPAVARYNLSRLLSQKIKGE